MQLEVCVDTVDGIFACQGRADRIELCSALSAGGLTPGPGLIQIAKDSIVPVHAMIRPRSGDFDFDSADLQCCLADIRAVRDAGLAGVVLGVSSGQGLNLRALREQVDAAGPMICTLHRVIDTIEDPIEALEQAIDLGFARILTSGGARRAEDGLERLAGMQDAAQDRIEIMVGSGVTAQNAARIHHATGIRSFHASCNIGWTPKGSAVDLGFAGMETCRNTDPGKIEALRLALQRISTQS